MKIVVCIKQVPASQDAKMDPQRGTLIRSGVEMAANPYDLAAVEAALRLREALGGRVTAFSMGPEAAEAVLRDALAMGADEAVLVSDRAFAGADVLATSHTLAQAIAARDRFQLILCGRQTTDGDTAQVGPAIAAQLGMPCVCWVSRIEAAGEDGLEVAQLTSRGEARVRVACPCVLCVEKDLAQPRIPGLRAKLAAGKQKPSVMSLADMEDRDPAHYGLEGSPTRVVEIYPPPRRARGRRLGETVEEAAEQLLEKLVTVREGRFEDRVWKE